MVLFLSDEVILVGPFGDEKGITTITTLIVVIAIQWELWS